MSTRSSNAYVVSTTLHLGVVGLIALFAYMSDRTSEPIAPKIMELVAGEGNNYGATVAPAIGVPGGIKVSIPNVPTPPAPPTPPTPSQEAPLEAAPTPAPPNAITKAPPEPKHVTKATATKAPPKPPDPGRDMVKDFKRIENKRAARLEAQYKKQQEAAAKRERAAELARQAANARHLDPEGIRSGVLSGSTENKDSGANGKALTREEGDLLAAYLALLESHVKDNHVQPDGLSDALTCKVSFFLSKDGTISSVRIVRSSGNAEFDQSVIEAFNKTTSIGPRPDNRGETLLVDFNLKENNE